MRFIREQEESFSQKSREFIQREIRKLFSKYDVLAKPRQVIREILLTPLRFIGVLREQDHREALLRVRQRIDLMPVQTAVESFNGHCAQGTLAEGSSRPFVRKHEKTGGCAHGRRDQELSCSRNRSDLSTGWKTSSRLCRRAFRGARSGGSTPLRFFGALLIIAFEIVVGGGFSILDAALDSAIAPFVTKGAVELFAYHEIQKVARELARRYQDGLLSVMKEQEKRYEACLDSLLTAKEVVED